MSALVSIQDKIVLKEFYKRKVEKEKKNEINVIIAVRNKLIKRIPVLFQINKKYEKNYQKLVA